jgi:glucose dehydrogenase
MLASRLVSHANPPRRHAAILVASAIALVLAGASALGQGDKAPAVDWNTHGADLASTRYSPLDQINRENFSKLQIAWRLKTDPFGPRPDILYSSTPLVVGNVLYTTAGTRRAVLALNAATGEILWMHTGRAPMGPISASSTSPPATG